MSGCGVCGGYGMRHDPIAHGAEPTWTDCRTCDGDGTIRDTAGPGCHVPGLRRRWGVGGVSGDWQDDAQALWQRMDEARDFYPDGTWAQRWIPGVCKHERTRCVHGDEIIARAWRRTACLTCGRSLKRPLPDMCWFSRQPHASAVES